MMRNIFFVLLMLALSATHATNLVQVYQQALISDPIYQQAVAQRLSDKEGVPISLSVLLPSLSLLEQPQITRSQYAGSQIHEKLTPSNQTNRQNNFSLTATQTVFNFGQYAGLMGARALSKKADATLSAATQSLMTRVAAAYFAILQDQDNIAYTAGARKFYAKQYDQINQQYKVGLKTITDVYTAQASYDSASATYIQAVTQLGNDRENLRAITGKYYQSLDKLSDKIPLVTPAPANIDEWEKIAVQQNWSIKAAQYNTSASLQQIRQQFAGNLPTVNVQGQYTNQYYANTGSSSPIANSGFEVQPIGPSRTINRQIQVNVALPIFAGGGVMAQTSQAQYNYDVAMQSMEQAVRQAINTTRQSYLGIRAGIIKIQADKQAIKSYISSLAGMDESYRVGTATLVDVLNQQQNLLNSQKTYASDRYTYINNLLALKQAAGTLGNDDMIAINSWLVKNNFQGIEARDAALKYEPDTAPTLPPAIPNEKYS